eukprot:NODE_84_length_22354_cov_0.646506.p17 type:complete len:138 gc:universal NODE_84_length_22354_cov_0.646506:9548-9961(+)
MVNAKKSKLELLIRHKVELHLDDHRILIGQLLAYDRHMNVVIEDCEEIRKKQRRPLGLLVVRGEHVQSVQSIAPPAAVKQKRTAMNISGIVPVKDMADRPPPIQGHLNAPVAPASGAPKMPPVIVGANAPKAPMAPK